MEMQTVQTTIGDLVFEISNALDEQLPNDSNASELVHYIFCSLLADCEPTKH